jgi:ketosteroid isomerase-like protein
VSDSNALDLTTEAWRRWVARDPEGFFELWQPDGVWTNSGRSLLSGQQTGVPAMREFVKRVFEISEGTLTGQPIEIASPSETTALVYFQVAAHRQGASIDQYALQRVVVEDGKIAEMHNMFADPYEVDTFFGPDILHS